ncbi:MAG TPA: hypothetical protein PK918_08460 [Methanotrichaceae archaeon]|nr:hypothetical protein [Methanotrichaceae archaeon]HQI92025.1 hypothetical protein [Methanotrichaceae archaeon]
MNRAEKYCKFDLLSEATPISSDQIIIDTLSRSLSRRMPNTYMVTGLTGIAVVIHTDLMYAQVLGAEA